MKTVLRRVKPSMYGVQPGANEIWSLEYDDAGTNNPAASAGFISRRYNAFTGALLGTIGSVSHATEEFGYFCAAIQHDPLGRVGDGSWVFPLKGNADARFVFGQTGYAPLAVFDPRNGQLYTMDIGSNVIASQAIPWQGHIYWVEFAFVLNDTTNPQTWTLKRAKCDLSSVETLNTIAVTAGPSFSKWLSSFFYMMLTPTHAICWKSWETGAHVEHVAAARIPLDGSSGTQDGNCSALLTDMGSPSGATRFSVWSPCAASGGIIGGAYIQSAGHYMIFSASDALPPVFSQAWPFSGDFIPGTPDFDASFGVAINLDGSLVCLAGSTAGSVPFYHTRGAFDGSGSPTKIPLPDATPDFQAAVLAYAPPEE